MIAGSAKPGDEAGQASAEATAHSSMRSLQWATIQHNRPIRRPPVSRCPPLRQPADCNRIARAPAGCSSRPRSAEPVELSQTLGRRPFATLEGFIAGIRQPRGRRLRR